MDDVRRYDDRIEGYFLEDLSVGMSASFAKTLTDADIILFSGVSGDTNPVHLNEEYARETLFKGRISHGMLSAGFISAVLGTKLPGPDRRCGIPHPSHQRPRTALLARRSQSACRQCRIPAAAGYPSRIRC